MNKTLLKKSKLFCAFVIWLSLLASYNEVKAQSTITLGIGTSSSYLYGPVYSFGTTAGRASRFAYVYPGSLLTGLSSGDIITSFEFNRATATQTFATGANLKIYVKNYSATDWGSTSLDFTTAITGATLVFDGDPAAVVGNSAGWKQFAFNNPYTWDPSNGANLAVICDYYQPAGAGTGTTINWYYDATAQYPAYTSNGVKYTTNSSIPPVSPATMTTSTANHPQIKINYGLGVPCTDPPSAGMALSSASEVCPSQIFDLSITGHSTGSGQTYQWQISSDNVNWTDIVGATSQTYSTSISSMSYFRCKVICSGGTPAYSLEVQVNSRGALTAGNYTINPFVSTGSNNFNTINEAISILNNCGISGPVVFDFEPISPPFNEKINLGLINGSSSTNTITFNGNGVTLFDTITGTETNTRYIVELNGAKYVTIQGFNLVIDSVNSTQGFNVHLTGGASYNTIRNNTILNSKTATSTSFAGIALSGAISSTPTTTGTFSHNIIENNIISGGYYGIVLAGAAGGASKKNIIAANKIYDTYQSGIYITGCDSNVVSRNEIARPSRTNSVAFYGIYILSNSYRTVVERNIIHDIFKSYPTATIAFYGIYASSTDTKRGDFTVKNNLIYNIRSNGAHYGLINNGSDSVQYFNNTVVFDDPNPSNAVVNGFLQTSIACLGVQLMNNIFYITRPGNANRVGEYWTTSTSTYVSDYNNFFITGGSAVNAIAFHTSSNSYTSLASWKLTGKDAHSLDVDPMFEDTANANFLFSNPAFNGAGIALANVTDDILGNPRVGNPDIGAFELPSTADDAGIFSIISPSEPVFTGARPLKVRIKNYGTNKIGAVTVNWTINGIQGTPFLYSDTIIPLAYIDTVIATPVFSAGPNEIMVWTSNPNNAFDTYNNNDSSSKFLYICSPFSGNYTIDKNAPLSVSNFHSVVSFVQKIQECGVSGPVEVSIANGTYQEQIVINNIPGVSAVNTVHFTSQSGDSSLVTITHLSGSSTTGNYVIRLSKVKHVSFSKLGFNRSGTLGYANVFELADSSSNITFNNNSFTGPVYTAVSTDGRYSAIYSQQASTHNNIVIKNNSFINNGNAVWIYNSAPIATKGTGFIAENNRVNVFYIGIFISNQHAPIITNNIITRNNPSSTLEFIGLGGNYISGPALYTNNKVFAGEGHFGLRLRGNVSTASNEMLIANNFFQTGGTSTSRGISLQDSFKYINIAHNSILTTGTSTSLGRSIAVTGTNATSGSHIHIYNNILSNTGGGYALYVQASDTNAVRKSDYNDIHSSGVNVGFWGANASNLSVYKSLSKKDSNSFSVDPLFVSDTDLHSISAVLNNQGLPLSYITTDIDGETRSIITPDIGADEYTPVANNLSVVEILYPTLEQIGCGSVSDSVVVAIQNLGVNQVHDFVVHVQISGDVNATFHNTVTDTLKQGDVRNVVLGYYNSKTSGTNTSMNLKVFTNLSGDADRTNDTVMQSTILNPSPLPPTIVNVGQACIGGSATVTASSPSSIYWYNAPSGGVKIGEGTTFNTPSLNANTTFYAEASNNTVAYSSVGPLDPVSVGTAGTIASPITTYYMEFQVLQDVTIETVDIFPSATVGSSGTIVIQTTSGQTVASANYVTTVTGGSTKQTIILDAQLTPGVYRMGQLAPALTLTRNSTGGVYPYTSPFINILSNNFNVVYYYYFYNWKLKSGIPGCASPRVPVNVIVNPKPSGSVISQGTVFNGIYNAGTLAQPDEVCVGDTVSYLVTAPTGLDLGGYGTTWTLTNVELKRLSGNAISGQLSNTNNAWSYVSHIGEADSILRYSAKVRNIATGCDTSIVRFIKVRSGIVVNLGSDTSICAGNTIQLTAPLASSYLWSTGATTRNITVSSSGQYTVTVTNNIGCSSSDAINVSIIPLPTVSLGPDVTVCAGTIVTLDAGNPGATYLWSNGATTQTIQVTSSGIYRVGVTTASGNCTGRDTILVIVNASPSVNLGADRAICPGDSTELDAGNPGANYLWSNGATTRRIWAKDTGNYSVVVTNSLNCSSNDALKVNYNDFPDASYSFTIPDTNALLVQFESLSQVNGQTYAWNFGDPTSGASNTSTLPEPTHTFTAAGTYSVRLIITNTATGCKTTEIKQVTVNSVGIAADYVKMFNVYASPNPFIGNTKIKYTLPENANDVNITVFDVLGRKVSNIISNANQTAGSYEFDFVNADTDNASGVYIVSLSVDGKVANIRVIDIAKQ